MTINPAMFALAVVFTIMLAIKFWVSGSNRLLRNLATFALLVSVVWIDAFYRSNHPREGWREFVTHPIAVQKPILWTTFVGVFGLIAAWGVIC